MVAPSEHNKIARADSPSREFFQENFVSRHRPVIISGAMKGWRALSLWNTDYLKAIIGTTKVRVEVSPTNYFPSLHGQDRAKIERHIEQIEFDSYAEVVASGNRAEDKYYLSDESLLDRFSALAEDIEYPAFLDESLRISNSWWFGSSETVTPLHYDIIYNLFVQVFGRKRFTLYAPQELPHLYPFPKRTKISHFSRVNIEKPDWVKFPKFQKARPLEFTLEPGEMLYIPPFWWHQVRSLDTVISLNFLWKLPWTGYLARPALRLAYPLLTDLLQSFRGKGTVAS